jgi:hypothetical protein
MVTSIHSIWEATPGEEVKLSKDVDLKMELPHKADARLSNSTPVIDLTD